MASPVLCGWLTCSWGAACRAAVVLQLVMPWIQFGFVGYLEVDQVRHDHPYYYSITRTHGPARGQPP